MEHLLPLGGAVHRGGLVQGGINAGDGRQVQYRGVADVLPHAAQGQNQGPIGGVVVEVGGLVPHALLDGGDHAAGGIQERQHEVAGHHPGQKVGEEHQRLVGFGHEAAGQLAHHHREGHGDHQPHDDPQRVVAQGVADHHRRVRRLEEGEVLQPHPFALDDVVPEGVGLVGAVVLEGDEDAVHGQVTQQQQPDGAGHDHGQQPEGLFPAGGLAGVYPGQGLPGGKGSMLHGTPPVVLVKPFRCFYYRGGRRENHRFRLFFVVNGCEVATSDMSPLAMRIRL